MAKQKSTIPGEQDETKLIANLYVRTLLLHDHGSASFHSLADWSPHEAWSQHEAQDATVRKAVLTLFEVVAAYLGSEQARALFAEAARPPKGRKPKGQALDEFESELLSRYEQHVAANGYISTEKYACVVSEDPQFVELWRKWLRRQIRHRSRSAANLRRRSSSASTSIDPDSLARQFRRILKRVRPKWEAEAAILDRGPGILGLGLPFDGWKSEQEVRALILHHQDHGRRKRTKTQ